MKRGMEFTVEAAELRNALQIVTLSLPSRPIIAVSECVLINIREGEIKLTCTDLVMQVTMSVESETNDEGQLAVRGKLFEEVVKKMPEGKLTVTVDSERKRMVIRGGAAKYQMSCMDPEEFPIKDDFEPKTAVRVTPSCLLEMITDTEACIARSDMREVLTGGCIDVEKGVVRMVALDGFRMAVKGFLCSCDDDMKAIIPGRSMTILKKVLGLNDDAPVDMEFGDGDFRLNVGNSSIRCTLINGDYVNWRGILPKSFNTVVTVSAENLRRAVDRAYIIAKSGANNLVTFDISDNILNINAQSTLDDMHDSMDVYQQGEPIKISFNVLYLNDLLKVFSSGDIVLKFVNGISPCIIEYAEPTSASDFFWLILPVRH